MREFPPLLWQIPLEDEDRSRFSVGSAQKTGDDLRITTIAQENREESDAETASLEALRADVTVALFNQLTAASIARPALAPILMDALDCALETLLHYKHPAQLCAVQEWLMPEW